jgi:hypothetical protein
MITVGIVIGALWTVIIVIVAIAAAYEFVVSYRKSTSTGWQRIWDGARGSATLVWMRLVFIVGAGIDLITELADFLGAPGVSDTIRQYADPRVVSALMIAIAIIGEFARRRKNSRGPV